MQKVIVIGCPGSGCIRRWKKRPASLTGTAIPRWDRGAEAGEFLTQTPLNFDLCGTAEG